MRKFCFLCVGIWFLRNVMCKLMCINFILIRLNLAMGILQVIHYKPKCLSNRPNCHVHVYQEGYSKTWIRIYTFLLSFLVLVNLYPNVWEIGIIYTKSAGNVRFYNNCNPPRSIHYVLIQSGNESTFHLLSSWCYFHMLQLTDWKDERLNTPTSQQNTWTTVLNFIEIYM